ELLRRASSPLKHEPLFAHHAEDVQNVDKERDEGAVEHEGTEDRLLRGHIRPVGLEVHVLDYLGLIGSQAREDQYDDDRKQKLEAPILDEEGIDEQRNQQTDRRHRQE